jgi:GNAT superfamily N-acetyltransferase
MNLADPAVVTQRFERGRHGYIGRIAGELVTYGWVTFDEEEIGEVSLSIHLKAGEAYIWHCATLADYRGQRLYSALLRHIAGELQRMDLHRAWIGTDNTNLPSQNGALLAGFQPVGDIMISLAAPARQTWLRGRPTASTRLVLDARHALFGVIAGVEFPEKGGEASALDTEMAKKRWERRA